MLDVIEGKDPAAERQGGAPDRHLRRSGEPVRRAARQEAQQELEAGRALVASSSAAALGQAEGDRHHPRRRAGRDDPDRRAHRRQPDARRGVGDLLVGDQAGDPHRQSVQAGRPQSDHGPRARAVRRRGQAAVGKARPGAEADPAHRPAPGRGRRHAARAHRRRLVADAGQAARCVAGDQERPRSPGLAVGAGAGSDRAATSRQRQQVGHAAEASWSPSSGSSASRRTICGAPA